jgi:hypothetical protein
MGIEQNFDTNDGHFPSTLYNCVAYNNGHGSGNGYGIRLSKYDDTNIVKNCISYKNVYDIGLTSESIHSNNSWDIGFSTTDADFLSLNSAGSDGSRQSDGGLPVINFLHPTSSSNLLNKGANVGIAFAGNAPNIGAY